MAPEVTIEQARQDQLLESLQAAGGRLTTLVSGLHGLVVNECLSVQTLVIGAAGYVETQFSVPFGSCAITSLDPSVNVTTETVLLNQAAIIDINPLTSASAVLDGATAKSLYIFNSLNQAGNYTVQYSRNGGVTWTNASGANPLAASSGTSVTLVTGTAPWAALTGLVRVVYTATVAPTGGALTMTLQTVGPVGAAQVVTVTTDPATGNGIAPPQGTGVGVVQPGRSAVFNAAGRTLTVYGTPGKQVVIQVFAKAQPPAWG